MVEGQQSLAWCPHGVSNMLQLIVQIIIIVHICQGGCPSWTIHSAQTAGPCDLLR